MFILLLDILEKVELSVICGGGWNLISVQTTQRLLKEYIFRNHSIRPNNISIP